MDPTRTRKANVDNYQGRRPASDGRGRLPYGYRLIETVTDEPGPLLQPDAVTAPVVRRIFSDYAEGKGLQAIAESLTSDGILCPSAYDRVRNPHFSGVAWSKGTVRAILVNTRYAEWGGIRSKPPGFQSPRICVVKLSMIDLRYSSSFGSGFSSAIFRPSSFRCMLINAVTRRAIGSRRVASNVGRSQ